ncbi:helix-turn-helix protein [Zymomonas mobilis]|uniref:helix-turn-helix domain-containing protein n=1 Tax=Zymomonas mobilis TaxID=542 RepID=UPI000B3727A8|nr:helix-turn-helix transcriptional regulator [Zymomonas mobilis]ART93595.1 hypothetical protein B9T50_05375 [Zymomonas mobilis subsp. mobilis]TWD60309.1 helix-turn-helix protein [Zymomonas mobilis]
MIKGDLYKEVSAKILRKRREKGISQLDLANKCNVSQAWIQKIESGNRKIPLDFIYKLSFYLDCAVSDLIPDRKKDSGDGQFR